MNAAAQQKIYLRYIINMATKTRKRSTKKTYASLRKYWNRVHNRIMNTRCVMQITKKYLSRPSPPYPANKCCGKTMTGNDGAKYTAKPSVSGICSWKKK
jgi:hypothetical protein